MDNEVAAEVGAAIDSNSFVQNAHTSREQNYEPERKQEQDSCMDNEAAAEVGAAIDTKLFIQNAHSRDIHTQDLHTQNAGTKTTSQMRTRTAESRTKWQAGDEKQRAEQNHTDKRHLQNTEQGLKRVKEKIQGKQRKKITQRRRM